MRIFLSFALSLTLHGWVAPAVRADESHSHTLSEHSTHHDHSPHGEEMEKQDNHDKHEEHEEGPSAGGVGPGKAVQEANPQDGMKLSEKAILTLKLQFRALSSSAIHKIPASALVFHQADVGVFRLRDAWIKLIDVDIVSKTTTEATVKSRELKPGDRIVSEGVSLLRIVELDITSGGGGHD